MKPRELTFIITALILAAVLGGVVGELVGAYLPDGGARTLLSKAITVGFEPVKVDLHAISFTIGLTFKIGFWSVLFVIFVLIYFRWWYL
jgi:hypothetical protein